MLSSLTASIFAGSFAAKASSILDVQVIWLTQSKICQVFTTWLTSRVTRSTETSNFYQDNDTDCFSCYLIGKLLSSWGDVVGIVAGHRHLDLEQHQGLFSSHYDKRPAFSTKSEDPLLFHRLNSCLVSIKFSSNFALLSSRTKNLERSSLTVLTMNNEAHF